MKSDTALLLTSIRSKWALALFLVPLSVYLIFSIYENELTRLVIPLFPEENDKSFSFYKDFLRLSFNEMLWLSFFLMIAWSIYVYGPTSVSVERIERRIILRTSLCAQLVIFVTFVGTIFIAYSTLHEFANSADEYVYLYQAETISKGRLWNEAHPLSDFFLYSHIPQKDGISVGRFPPGWPLVLSLPLLLNVPPLWVNPVIAAVTLWLFFCFGARYYGHRLAFWALISLAFTSFYLFNSASFFSHNACLLMVMGFIYSLYLRIEKGSWFYALLSGACLGLIVITRYYNAVLLVIPVLIYLFYQYRWRCIPTLLFIGIGCLPFFLFLFWYNYSITGNGFLPVTVWADQREGLGWIRGHTPIDGIEHFIRRVFLFVYWSSPALLLLYFIYLHKKIRDRLQRFFHPEDYYLLMLIIGYFFYYHIGGNQYGPRFWFEGTPFVTLFVVKKVFDARARWAWALFAAGFVYGIAKMPYIINREHLIVEERLDLYSKVAESKISNAVVLVASHTGIIRPMGEMDLTRNGVDYNASVLYAHDLGERNRELMEFYPKRSFYKYVRDPEIVEGKLIRIR